MIRSNVNPMTFPELFTAGHARLTLVNNSTGTHTTIHVKQARDKKDRKKKVPVFFVRVSLLGDGDADYVFGGTYFQETGNISLAKGVAWDSQLGKVMAFIYYALKDPRIFRKKNASLMHEGRCCRCGLSLTNPTSIQHGLGDDCYTWINGSDEEKKELALKLEKRKKARA
jgi:hypothetical protein